jgi:hypothetical protein
VEHVDAAAGPCPFLSHTIDGSLGDVACCLASTQLVCGHAGMCDLLSYMKAAVSQAGLIHPPCQSCWVIPGATVARRLRQVHSDTQVV